MINTMKIAIVDDDSVFMDEVKDIIVERINKIGSSYDTRQSFEYRI